MHQRGGGGSAAAAHPSTSIFLNLRWRRFSSSGVTAHERSDSGPGGGGAQRAHSWSSAAAPGFPPGKAILERCPFLVLCVQEASNNNGLDVCTPLFWPFRKPLELLDRSIILCAPTPWHSRACKLFSDCRRVYTAAEVQQSLVGQGGGTSLFSLAEKHARNPLHRPCGQVQRRLVRLEVPRHHCARPLPLFALVDCLG